MENHMKIQLEKFYNEYGIDETLKFIFYSEKVPYLEPTKNISKVIELVSLSKGERSIVMYLNYLEDKKRTITPSYCPVYKYDGENGAKMSQRQLKYMKSIVASLSLGKLTFLKSFIGVLELNQDELRLERVKTKTQKINALYTAKLPLCDIDFIVVVESLNSNGVKSSVQDVIAFLSLIDQLSDDDGTVNIPAPFWQSIFGKNNIKVAKQVFINLGILKPVSKYIPGFKSEGYKIMLYDELYDENVSNSIVLDITSIKTLEKINRIKKYTGNFTLNGKIEALSFINDLKKKNFSMSGCRNLTSIFLELGKLQFLIDDLICMKDILNDKVNFANEQYLGSHLSSYFNAISKGRFKDYKPFYEKSSS